MTKYIIALVWCMHFGVDLSHLQMMMDLLKNKNKDLLNVQVDCMNTKNDKTMRCKSFASLMLNYNEGITIQDDIVRPENMHTLLKIHLVIVGMMMQKMVDGRLVTMIENVQKFPCICLRKMDQSGQSLVYTFRTSCNKGVTSSAITYKKWRTAYMLRWKANKMMM